MSHYRTFTSTANATDHSQLLIIKKPQQYDLKPKPFGSKSSLNTINQPYHVQELL